MCCTKNRSAFTPTNGSHFTMSAVATTPKMRSKRKSLRKLWAVSEKLEIVQALRDMMAAKVQDSDFVLFCRFSLFSRSLKRSLDGGLNLREKLRQAHIISHDAFPKSLVKAVPGKPRADVGADPAHPGDERQGLPVPGEQRSAFAS